MLTKNMLTKSMLTENTLTKNTLTKNTLTKIRFTQKCSQKIRSLFALSFLTMVTSHLKINRCPHPGQVAFDKQVGKVSQTNCLYELIKEFGTPHKKMYTIASTMVWGQDS